LLRALIASNLVRRKSRQKDSLLTHRPLGNGYAAQIRPSILVKAFETFGHGGRFPIAFVGLADMAGAVSARFVGAWPFSAARKPPKPAPVKTVIVPLQCIAFITGRRAAVGAVAPVGGEYRKMIQELELGTPMRRKRTRDADGLAYVRSRLLDHQPLVNRSAPSRGEKDKAEKTRPIARIDFVGWPDHRAPILWCYD
jgi:hypothetical protein